MDRSLFKQIPIKSDNACFYRSCSYYLFLYTDKDTPVKNIIDKGPDENIKSNRVITRKMINDNNLPELLQKKICDWVYHHHDSKVKELGYSVLDLLIDTHYSHLIDSNIDKMDILYDYYKRYNIFAAEKNDEIDERWGGSLDMYVLTQLYNIEIKIYQENESKKYELIQKFGDDTKRCISLLYKNGIHYVVLLPKNI